MDRYSHRRRERLNNQLVAVVTQRIGHEADTVQAAHTWRHLVAVRRESAFRQTHVQKYASSTGILVHGQVTNGAGAYSFGTERSVPVSKLGRKRVLNSVPLFTQ